jgi:hypothetical protein
MTAPLSDTVNIQITSDSVALARASFGSALLLSATASFAERVRTYNSLADVAVDFPTTTSAEYRAAQLYFGQSPRPTTLKIGRSANKPTQVYTISIATVRNSYTYSINVKGKGFTDATASFTSDASATDAEIVAGLVTALNAVSGNNYIAAGASSPFTVTADNPGDWFSLEVDSPSGDWTIRQSHADPGIATDLDAILLADSDWYVLLTAYNSPAYVTAAAAWVEAAVPRKIYLADDCGSLAITATVAGGGNDVADTLHTSAYRRTAVAWHKAPAAMLAAAWAGKRLPIDPGGETWKFAQLAGVSGTNLNATHRVNLRAKKANWLEATGATGNSINIMYEGTVASAAFIDEVRGDDFVESDMTVEVFTALVKDPKVPYTDPGVAVVEAAVRASLQRAVDMGIYAASPSPVVTVPLVANVSASDKAARKLTNVKWSATRAGAIHKVDPVNGVVSV